VQPVDLGGALTDHGFAVARQVADLTDLRWRHEALAQQPVLQQPAQPRRVAGVRLATGDVLDVLSVDQPHVEVALEHVVDGLPVDACALHRDMRHAALRKPGRELQQVRGRRPERCELLRSTRTRARNPDAYPQLRLVNIDPRTPLDNQLQLRHVDDLLLDDTQSPRRGACRSRVCSACSTAQVGVPKLPRHAQGDRTGQSRPDDGHHGTQTFEDNTHFHPSRVGASP
jgi:hypothetical protein